MRRLILFVSAAALLVCAVTMRLVGIEDEMMLAFCWRAGAVLAAAWLAYDDIQRLPNWILLTLPVVLIILARWPKLIPAVIVVLILWGIFRRIFPPPK